MAVYRHIAGNVTQSQWGQELYYGGQVTSTDNQNFYIKTSGGYTRIIGQGLAYNGSFTAGTIYRMEYLSNDKTQVLQSIDGINKSIVTRGNGGTLSPFQLFVGSDPSVLNNDNYTYFYGAIRGDDVFYGNSSDDNFGAYDSNLDLGNDTFFGADGDDIIADTNGTTGNAYIFGGAGNDRMYGRVGNDHIEGGLGNDYVSAGPGADVVYDGDDGSGNDTFQGGGGTDLLIAGLGDDELYGEEDNDTIYGGDGNDTIQGGTGNDVLFGDAGADSMFGGEGNDLFSVDNVSDTVIAGGGYDEIYTSVDYSMSIDAETLFLTGTARNATGNSGNNTIIGNDLDNIIDAGAGTMEFLNGAGGNDLLIGGAGHDEINGGAGNDTFRFTALQDAGDFFYDFTPGQDKIQLNAAAFGIGTASNPLVAGRSFINGPDVTTAAPTLLYTQTNGTLFYDADGTGSQAPVVLAILNGTPALTASDITVY